MKTLKQVGKFLVTVLVTVTFPLWLLPFLGCLILFFVGAGIHDALWGEKRKPTFGE